MSKASTNSQKQVKRSSSTTTPTSTSIPSVFIATVLAVAVSFLVMRYSTAITAALPFLTLVVGNNDGPSYKVDVDAIKPLTISAEGINATFIGHGARLTSLYVNDKDGNPREVVVGYDDPAQYVRDTATTRSFFGCVAGRYANRIKNGTFQIDGTDYQVPKNEHNGLNTLHGGDIGYDGRNWTVTEYNTSSITYTLIDPSGFQGFPGALVSHVTYSVSPATSTSRGKFTARIIGISLDQLTPVNLVTHIYWNLGSFTQPTILNDTLHLPYGNRVISTDSIQVPTGELQSVKWPWASPSVPLNFTSPKSIGEGSLYSKQCGDGCTGIDNAFILDRPVSSSPESQESAQLIWSSADTGLTMKVRTNQQSIQLYDCTGMNGTYTSHASQGSPTVGKYGCLVIEPQQWIDGINHPEWGQSERQLFGPQTGPSVNWAEYDFSV